MKVGIQLYSVQNKADYIILEQDHTVHDEFESIRISMESFKKFKGLEW
jgi:hypothetical protein